MKTLIAILLLCLVSACGGNKALTMHEANIHYEDKDLPAVVFVKNGKIKSIVVK